MRAPAQRAARSAQGGLECRASQSVFLTRLGPGAPGGDTPGIPFRKPHTELRTIRPKPVCCPDGLDYVLRRAAWPGAEAASALLLPREAALRVSAPLRHRGRAREDEKRKKKTGERSAAASPLL